MNAAELKKIVKTKDSVKVRIVATEIRGGEGNMSDQGDSVAGISTYLRTGMLADITDACTMPPIHESLLDAKHYHEDMLPGRVYFVFHHAPYLAHNEAFAETNWGNDRPGMGERAVGTAAQVGAYSGYDMIGFAEDDDMSKLVELLTT